jgi:hypothetical protein
LITILKVTAFSSVGHFSTLSTLVSHNPSLLILAS